MLSEGQRVLGETEKVMKYEVKYQGAVPFMHLYIIYVDELGSPILNSLKYLNISCI